MTFLEAHWLTQAYWQQQARRDRPLAMLVQILLNVHRGEHVSAFELSDVMQWLGHRELEPPKPQPTVEELKSQMELLHGLYAMGQNGQGG